MTNQQLDALHTYLLAKANAVIARQNLQNVSDYDTLKLCTHVEEESHIHLYEGIEDIAQAYSREVQIDQSKEYYPQYKHFTKIILNGVTLTLFQLVTSEVE